MFYTDVQTGTLHWLSPGGSPAVFGTGFAGKVAPPAIGPQGIAFDGRRTLYVADGDRVWRITGPAPTVPAGYQIDKYLAGVGAATGLTIAPDGSLWIADYLNGRVLRSTSPGSFSVVASGIADVEGVAFAGTSRVFAVSSTGASSTVHEITSGSPQPFATGLSYPTSIATKGNELFVSNSGDGTISRILLTGSVSNYLSGVGNPYGISFDTTGRMFYIDHAGGMVYSYDAVTPPVGISSVTPSGGTFTGSGFDGKLFFTDVQTGTLYSLAPGGSRAVFGTGFAGKVSPPAIGPQGIAFDGQNTLYVGDGDQVWRITGPSTLPAPPIVSLSASPTSIAANASSTLAWSSTNATSCTASGGWSGARATSGSETTSVLSATTSFTLTCTGPGGTGSKSVSVTVAAPPTPTPTVSLSASPTSIAAGATSTLTWASTDATACTASGGWSGSRATSGSDTTALSATTAFTLTCTGPGGTASSMITVTVTAPPSPTVSLSASPASIAAGATTTLTWSTTNATTCAASNGWSGARATSGSEAISALSATTAFTLTCTGPGGTGSQTITVSVTTQPPPKSSGGGGGAIDYALLMMLLGAGFRFGRTARAVQSCTYRR